ncbi:MAG: hypothetical protein GY723_11070 [bacterium]|nr:hypothetical protein [bacterium]
MILAQGRFWRAQVRKGSQSVTLTILREDLPLEVEGVRDLRIDVPLKEWNRVVKYARADRKLLGGILLDFAKHKDRLAAAIGHDGLYLELEQLLVDVTVNLVHGGILGLSPVTEDG